MSKPWKPDWSLPPGEILTEIMEERGISPVEMCALTGMTSGVLEAILTGTERISTARAERLEAALGVSAQLWINLQQDYDSRRRGMDESIAPREPRELVGRMVRQIWVEWAREQPDPKPSWLLPWEELDDGQREVDMRIGDALFDAGKKAGHEYGRADADAGAGKYRRRFDPLSEPEEE